MMSAGKGSLQLGEVVPHDSMDGTTDRCLLSYWTALAAKHLVLEKVGSLSNPAGLGRAEVYYAV